MTLKIYNTLTRRKEDFQPIQEGRVGIYVCGITAYDCCHVGHARSAVVFDVMTRYLRYKGNDVVYVKNFTDVDDKIIARANAEGVGIRDISEKYISEHNRDMDELGVERPTFNPRATEYIDGMIELITALIKKGFAYSVDGDVYYSVDSFKEYGKLSGRNKDDMIAGARVEVDERKRNPLDFALWKSSKQGEPWWKSPWGNGRPGWHIECSVMSQKLLGDTFDIHGGGEDLIFPHHENEIAQSEGASGRPLARYWIHNGFVKINSEKMSKSLGNVFAIRDILEQYHPEILRFFFLQSHYRSPVDFSDASLSEARAGMERFYATLGQMEIVLKKGLKESGEMSGGEQEIYDYMIQLPAKFSEAMDDDFNTARAIGYLFDAIRHINAYMGEGRFKPTPQSIRILKAAASSIRETGSVLGLFRDDPESYFLKDRDRQARKRGIDVQEIENLIAERGQARRDKNWSKADAIREKLAHRKIIIMDSAAGTSWRIE